MQSRLLLPLKLSILLIPLLIAGVSASGQKDPRDEFRTRLQALIEAENTQLADLAGRFAEASSRDEAVHLQQRIDLVKRTAELRLLELQDVELQRRGEVEAREQLLPLLENCRAQVLERQKRYGMELPVLRVDEE